MGNLRALAIGAALAAAVKGNASVRVAKGDADCDYDRILVGSNVTLDGGGATLWFSGTSHNGRGIHVSGDNVIVRNLRVRNGGDNIAFGSGASTPATNVLLEDVSATGSGDGGFSSQPQNKSIPHGLQVPATEARLKGAAKP